MRRRQRKKILKRENKLIIKEYDVGGQMAYWKYPLSMQVDIIGARGKNFNDALSIAKTKFQFRRNAKKLHDKVYGKPIFNNVIAVLDKLSELEKFCNQKLGEPYEDNEEGEQDET